MNRECSFAPNPQMNMEPAEPSEARRVHAQHHIISAHVGVDGTAKRRMLPTFISLQSNFNSPFPLSLTLLHFLPSHTSPPSDSNHNGTRGQLPHPGKRARFPPLRKAFSITEWILWGLLSFPCLPLHPCLPLSSPPLVICQ